MIDRCGDRQRKCDGLEKWPLHLFVESLPVMLQVSLLLLACGLCRHMWSINTSVAYTLLILTGLGVLFYVGIVIAGTSSYACPFQTPVSIAFRSRWKKLRCGITTFIIHRKLAFSYIHRMCIQDVRSFLRHQYPPMIPLENIRVQSLEPRLEPKDLAAIRRTNANDVRCVSWVLRNITDQEALDTAIRLAGTIRWFEDGTNVESPYNLIISAFRACFDSSGKAYPESRDRAYYSGRAILWIRTLAACKSQEFVRKFPCTIFSHYTAPTPDHDLTRLLTGHGSRDIDLYFIYLLDIDSGPTPSGSQWISNLLLSFLGQPDLVRLRLYPTSHSQGRQEYYPSGCNAQPPPSVVHLPRFIS